jgi:flagellar basal-body rod modification protein FlgD
MDLYSISSTASISSGSSATASDASAAAQNELGKDAFLKLLTAQLSNQDPLEPVDNQAFIAQLAQFSSLEQLQGVSSRLDSLLLATTSSTQLGTASFVGREVTYRASSVGLTEGERPTLKADVGGPATVTALVRDASGRAVRTLIVQAREAGTVDLGWDGTDADGNDLPAGTYSVSVAAIAADGRSVDAQAISGGTVRGVSYAGSTPALLVGSSEVPVSDVLTVVQSSTSQPS